MGRGIAGTGGSGSSLENTALAVTAVCFLAGTLLGCFMALHGADEGQALRGYLDSFLSAAETGALREPGPAGLIWRTVRWPLAAVLLGFTALGLLGIPLLSLARGFFLSFSVTSFAVAYGDRGLEAAFLLLGLSGLLSVPAFFILSVQGLCSAWRLSCRSEGQGGGLPFFGREQLMQIGACAGLLILSVLLEYRLVPLLLMGLAGPGQS